MNVLSNCLMRIGVIIVVIHAIIRVQSVSVKRYAHNVSDSGLEIIIKSTESIVDNGEDLEVETCPLTSRSKYPWLVKILDRKLQKAMAHGIIIAQRAVLSSRSAVDNMGALKRLEEFELIAFNVWEVNSELKECNQTRIAYKIDQFPKCSKLEDFTYLANNEEFHDFAVWVLNEPYHFGDNYYMLTFPESTASLIKIIEKLDSSGKPSSCVLPTFANWDTSSTFNPKTLDVGFISYRPTCINMLCEMNTANENEKQSCDAKYQASDPDTLLCVFTENTAELPDLGERKVNWYAGAPLVCDGIAIGMTSQFKHR